MGILDGIKTIRSCEHEPEVEVRYNDSKTLRFRMCRECWEHTEYHEISKDYVQAIRPNQLDVEHAKCLRCGSGSCQMTAHGRTKPKGRRVA